MSTCSIPFGTYGAKGTVGQFLAGVADCMKWLRRETIGFVKGDAKPVYHFAWTNATP